MKRFRNCCLACNTKRITRVEQDECLPRNRGPTIWLVVIARVLRRTFQKYEPHTSDHSVDDVFVDLLWRSPDRPAAAGFVPLSPVAAG